MDNGTAEHEIAGFDLESLVPDDAFKDDAETDKQAKARKKAEAAAHKKPVEDTKTEATKATTSGTFEVEADSSGTNMRTAQELKRRRQRLLVGACLAMLVVGICLALMIVGTSVLTVLMVLVGVSVFWSSLCSSPASPDQNKGDNDAD